MTNNLGNTEASATETVEDVEGHRVAPFIEDHKDTVTGSLPSLRRLPSPDEEDDVEGHRMAPFVEDDQDDVEGHRIKGW